MRIPSREKFTLWLSFFALFFYLISTIGKQQFPVLFSIGWVGWVYRMLWGVSTIVIPLGFFFALASLFSSEVGTKARKGAGGMGWVFLLFFCSNVFLQVLGGHFIDKVMYTLKDTPNDFVSKEIAHMATEKSVLKKEQLASSIYRNAGVAVPYELDNGLFVRFQPTAKDDQQWAKTQGLDKSSKKSLAQIKSMVDELFLSTLIEIAAFFVIFTGGILITCYSSRSKKVRLGEMPVA
jgi:hypothetical protein